MIKKYIALRTIILFFFLPGILWSQNGSGAKGEVQIYIFTDKGLPLEGARIDLDGGELQTDSSGFVFFYDGPGPREYEVRYDDMLVAKIGMTLVEGQITEALVTVSLDGESVTIQEEESPADLLAGMDRARIDENLPKGTLAGKLRHIETEEEIVGATVIFRGVALETITDGEGFFAIQVPEGTYSISLIHPDFSTRTIDNLEVKENQTNQVDILMTPSAITLDAVTVYASTEVRVQGGIADLIEETKNSGVMLNLIGAEQMSKAGDSDAASALSRVTGLTIVDGRFVYVRGMGERYSVSYLNGAKLPSPELDKRVVPLDLFPTTVLESLVIQKTYSPDLYGDFAGGSVGLRTAGIPNDRYKRRLRTIASASVSFDMDSTFTEQLMDTAGSLDFLGIDDGGRKFPESIGDEEVTSGTIMNPGMTDGQIEQAGEALNRDWDGDPGVVPLDLSLSLSLRDKVDFDRGGALGWNLSVLYKNDWDVTDSVMADYAQVDPSVLDYRFDFVTTAHNIDIGGLLDLEYRPSDALGIGSTTLLVRTTKNEAQNYHGIYDEYSYSNYAMSWVESMLLSQRLGGDIRFNGLNEAELSWQYTFSRASSVEPNSSIIQYARSSSSGEDEPYELFFRDNAAQILNADVKDNIHDGGIRIEIPIFWFSDSSADYLDLGLQGLYQERDAAVRRFAYGPVIGTEEDLTVDPDELFTDENIGDEIMFAEYTKATDNYKGTHLMFAGYVDSDIILPLDIRMTAGIRGEYSNQAVETFALYGGYTANASLTAIDVLPSLNFTFPIIEDMQLRLGGSRTVNRPDLRELSEAPKNSVEGAGPFVGNPDLKRAEIYNADLRWEYYITEQENVSAGLFYKYFINAIEIIKLAGENAGSTLGNVPTAYNLGLEFEWRLSLRYISDGIRSYVIENRPSPGMRKALGAVSSVFRDMNTSGNISFIRSEIDYKGNQGINTSEKRSLQGQSPWIINASLGYKNAVSWSQDRKTHTSVNLNYNVFGPRISGLGTEGLPDYYDMPFHQLDLIMKHSFNEVFSIGFSLKNLLDLPAIEMVGSEIVNEVEKGRSFSLSVKFDL